MKKLSYFCICTLVCSLLSCKDANQELLNDISGTWKVDEITYFSYPYTVPDSIVKYPSGVLQFDNCQLSGSIRECSGFYKLVNSEVVSIVYNANAARSQTFISIMSSIPKFINLLGAYNITRSGNKMILEGPEVSVPDYKGPKRKIQLSK
ncbi:hypothetical protein [Flectobacillus rivi]|uniref:Lipocalin-like domain-containing protein n=1 Tax=Flectobacillus rivi TaxID=2984209 RepID=A0ABT6YWK0_9BACT|nr:hypothetical protein [Flectobacillus rivi]MDI9873082.1 hypothetical protein [Flectobacillus rivi]